MNNQIKNNKIGDHLVELYLVEQKDHYFTKDLWKELLDLVLFFQNDETND